MKVLIVDDNPAGLNVVTSMLRDEGYTLVTCTDGETAIELARRELPEVILLDVMMPGLSGFEVCARIRAVEEIRDISIIMLTALNDRASRIQGFADGADDFMSKPLDSIELRLRLRTLARLNRFRERLQIRSYYEDLARLTPDVILSLGAAGTITGGNPKAIQLLGELGGRWFASLFTEEDRAHARAAWEATLTDAEGQVIFTAGMNGQDRAFPAELTLRRIARATDAGDAILIVRDLSDHTRLQARLERANRLESLAVASGGVAHDFANALVAVRGALQLAEAGPGSPTGQGALREARELLTEATTLVRRINQFARPRAPLPQPVDLRRHVQEAWPLLLHLADGAELELDVVLDPNQAPAIVHADPTEITQVLSNLVANGRDASPPGGRVRVRVFEHGMRTPDSATANGWCIEVADSGAGMPPDVLARVFEPYFTTKPATGTGLGLPTVREIAQRSGGSITLDSTAGIGTTARFWLPDATSPVRGAS